MNGNHEDPQVRQQREAFLTAYALGQLNDQERTEAETLVAKSAEARQFVHEIEALAKHVEQAHRESPVPAPSPDLRAMLEQRLDRKEGAVMSTSPEMQRRKTRWFSWPGLLATGICVLILVGLVIPGVQPAREATRLPLYSMAPPAVTSMPKSSVPSADEPPIVYSPEGVWRQLPARRKERWESSTKDIPYTVGKPEWNQLPPPRQYNTEQYDRIVESQFQPAMEQPLSTFSVDVDTASYANVRRFLCDGKWPPPDAVRIEELLNYFKYDYAGPKDKTPFAVHLEVAQCPWTPQHRLLRVGLKGREIRRDQRGPSNLVFLLDVSGSMGEPDKLPLVKSAMRMLVEQLGEDDRVAIVTYANGTQVRLPSARGHEKGRILGVIESLEASGCTNGGAGIQLAYQQAQAHFVAGGVNRVILCTDGDLNVGVTSDDDLVGLIQAKAKSGVFLTVLGFGTGNLKDGKLEKIADKGNGVYAYVDGLREARRILVEQLTGSLVTIAKDVKLQIEFNPAEVRSYRLIGYENRVMAHQDFNNDRKDAGDIGAGHTVTALYELVPAGLREETPVSVPGLKYQRQSAPKSIAQPGNGELLTLRLRYKEPDRNESRLLEFTAKDSGKRFGEASSDFRFATAVAAFGMVLRDSANRGRATLATVEEFAAGALGKDPHGYRAEFLDLVRRAKMIRPGQ